MIVESVFYSIVLALNCTNFQVLRFNLLGFIDLLVFRIDLIQILNLEFRFDESKINPVN